MKAFFMAMIALVAVTIAADQLLNRAGFSSAEMYSTANVRLGS
ncbi:MAG TPA: hypothetical protein VK090_01705 [Paracoccaceae bacterium]|nr:hypothetical protein [Paracoccaceae bacterium]